MADARESTASMSRATPDAPGIAPNRGWNVPIRIRVAMQYPAESATHNRQIFQIQPPHQGVRRAIEVERKRPAARLEHTPDLVNRCGKIRDITQAVSCRHEVEGGIRKRQRDHSPTRKTGRAEARGVFIQTFAFASSIIRGVTSRPITGCNGCRSRMRCHLFRWPGPMPIAGRGARETDQAPFPASIQAERQHHGNEIVAIGDRRKQRPDVPTLAFRRRDAIGDVHSYSAISHQLSVLSCRLRADGRKLRAAGS